MSCIPCSCCAAASFKQIAGQQCPPEACPQLLTILYCTSEACPASYTASLSHDQSYFGWQSSTLVLLGLCRSSSAQVGDQRTGELSVLRPVNGHRATQSVIPSQGKPHQHAGHLRTASSPYDQSLHQLVQSRTLHRPLQPEDAPGPSSSQAAAPLTSTPDHLDHQRQLPGQLQQQRSGNPFASESSAAGTGSSNGLLTSSSSAQLGSGNPFRHTAEADAIGMGQEVGQNRQASIPIAWDQGGSPNAHSDLLKTAEMSPLQNGLIRSVQSSSSSGLALDMQATLSVMKCFITQLRLQCLSRASACLIRQQSGVKLV